MIAPRTPAEMAEWLDPYLLDAPVSGQHGLSGGG